ncbi:Dbl homology domain-containing protein [Xylaria nigripes]|nr:Dbl homology domain-containing protein [Xylaria nigripes]
MPFTLLASDSPRSFSRSSSLRVAKGMSWVRSLAGTPTFRLNRTDPDLLYDGLGLLHDEDEDIWKALDNITAFRLSLENDEGASRRSTDLPRLSIGQDNDSDIEEEPGDPLVSGNRPFHKWMKSLHKRAHRHTIRTSATEVFPEHLFDSHSMRINQHRKSSSGSSFGFVAAVKSATVSLASASVRTRQRNHTSRSSINTRTDHSSRGSFSAHRMSEDSTCVERSPHTDPAVTERLLQRRRILEELITTEESYIGDIRFLMNVYVTILASLPTPHHGLRSSINQNLTDIIELHEEILGELHRIVPDSEYTQPDHIVVKSIPPVGEGHHRWHSLDSVPEDRGGPSWLQSVPSVVAEPSIAAEVAQIFGRKMNRFFIYEEYGARYELMIKDVASTHRMLPHWEDYQKGIEALAASLSTANNHSGSSRKSLTIGDLLVKPIQRICRYPLLFAELLKYTPVCDCPDSHMEIESVLMRLREATAEINRATDDPGVKVSLEQTWLLQDRLVFPNQRTHAASKSTIRSLGQIRLCGVLHVCWQTRDGVMGQYMISLLYRDCLCLATAGKADQVYTIQACISLDTIKIEEADNGRGLQCHTAPFSWKLVFECDHQLYEMIMSACSQKEEMEWRRHLSDENCRPCEQSASALYSSNSLHIKSLGTVFRKPGSVARRLSIHRATTIGPKSPLCQVIIKNTSTVNDAASTNLPSSINRSQSLLTTNSRIPVLAPPRAERARLEAQLADVWSRKILPYPGMTTWSRNEHRVRSSASTMMRKLSAASLSNPFARRSLSTANLMQAEENDHHHPHVNTFIDSLVSVNCDGITPSRSEVMEGGLFQRLPMIRDETERTDSQGSESPAPDGTTPEGTVRRIDMAKVETIWGDEKGLSTPPLRTSSRLSVRPQKRPTPTQSPPYACSVEANRSYRTSQGIDSVRDCLGTTRSRSRWTRVSVLNRGLSALGSRSFFN